MFPVIPTGAFCPGEPIGLQNTKTPTEMPIAISAGFLHNESMENFTDLLRMTVAFIREKIR